jgi:AraC-like DNA-binding protein/DNA gyrase inhibitor GyrI
VTHPGNAGPVDRRVELAVLEITRRFRDPLSLHDLAASVGLSPHHFHRLFLQAFGETPMAYLRRIRVAHADHLLVALPDAPLIAVAIESGFSSPACFSRAYRQHYGHAPGKVRNQLTAPKTATAGNPASRPVLSHFPTRHLKVVRHTLDDDHISEALGNMAGDHPHADRSVLGIFVDAPFHVPRAQCRYFLAWDSETGCEAEQDVLTLPGGYYARMEFTGPTVALGPAVFAFHDEVLVPSAYALASTLFFERIRPSQQPGFAYSTCRRELFLKVRHKGEQVI